MELRYKHCAALERAKNKLDEIDQDFGEFFGRSYGGQIEEYRTEDADIVILTSGSAVGTARTVVDAKRAEGIESRVNQTEDVPSLPAGEIDSGNQR